MHYEERDGATTSPEDIVGLPIPDHARRVTVYYPPEALVRDEAFGLLLDDIPNARLETLRAFYKLMLDKKTDSFKMPEGSIVIGTGNTTSDNAYVDPLPAPLVNRVVLLRVRDDAKLWLRYGRQHGFHPLVLEFIESRPSMIRSASNPHGLPFSSQRSLHVLSDALHSYNNLTERVVEIAAEGTLAAEHALAFKGFYKAKGEKLSVERLLKGDLRWPGDPKDRQSLVFLEQSFRLHLIKHLPATVDAVTGKARMLAHEAKGLIASLAEISAELAQHVIVEIDGEKVPDWFVVEVTRDLPRIAVGKK